MGRDGAGSHCRSGAEIARRQDSPLRQAQDGEPDDPFTKTLRGSYHQLGAQKTAALAVIAVLEAADDAEPHQFTRDDATPLDAQPPNGTEGPAVKPRIYGYLRVVGGLADATIAQQERGLRKLADAEGFRLAETYYEYQPGYYGTFCQLIAELAQRPVHHLAVPSLEHLSAHPLLRAQMLRRLDEAGVQVWTVEP